MIAMWRFLATALLALWTGCAHAQDVRSQTAGPAFPYASGTFVTGEMSHAGSAGTAALSTNFLYAWPFLMNGTATWTSLSINVTSTGSAANCRLGFFGAGADAQPSSLIADAGTVSVGTTGTKSALISQLLGPGLTYGTVVCDGSVTLTGVTIGNQASANKYLEMIGITAYATDDSGIVKPFTFGALSGASPWGTAIHTAASMPIMALKK